MAPSSLGVTARGPTANSNVERIRRDENLPGPEHILVGAGDDLERIDIAGRVVPVMLGSHLLGPDSWPIQSDRESARAVRLDTSK